MAKVSEIKKWGESLFYFKVSPEDYLNKEISLHANDGVLLRFPYPLDNLPEETLVRLTDKVILSQSHENVRQRMLEEVPVGTNFVHTIFAAWILQEKAVLYTSEVLTPLVAIEKIPMRKFVTSPGYKNLFFVMDCDLKNMQLICVEVHPSKPLTYRLAWLNLSQVSLVQWQGPEVPIENLKEFFSLTEDDFNRKWREIEMRENESSAHPHEEF